MYYTQKNFKKQEKSGRNCNPLSRCHNYKVCPTCARIRENKIKKNTSHISETEIKKYKYKKYIVVTSKDIDSNVYFKNANIDYFLKEFLTKKRNKNFIIDSSTQYFITKEISYNKKFDYNPHLNIILLSNKKIDIDNKQFKELTSRFRLDIHIKDITKRDGTYKKSIDSLISYSIKFDKNRSILERDISLTKNKRDIFSSTLFDKKKYTKLQRNLYIYIRAFKEIYKAKRTEIINKSIEDLKAVKTIYKRNAKKTNIKQYIRLNKSLHKKINFINRTKARKLKRLSKRFSKHFT